jgi:hypothetical protein
MQLAVHSTQHADVTASTGDCGCGCRIYYRHLPLPATGLALVLNLPVLLPFCCTCCCCLRHSTNVPKCQDLAAVLEAEYPQGIDIVYEGVGGAVRAAIMPHLAPGGRLLQVGYISGACAVGCDACSSCSRQQQH